MILVALLDVISNPKDRFNPITSYIIDNPLFVIALIVFIFFIGLSIGGSVSSQNGRNKYNLGYTPFTFLVVSIGFILVALPFFYEKGQYSIYELIKEATIPFLSLVSIILLYTTLKQQIRFNRLQIEINEHNEQKALIVNEKNLIMAMQAQITNLIDQCTHKEDNGDVYKSIDAIQFCARNSVVDVGLIYRLMPIDSLLVSYFITVQHSTISDFDKKIHFNFAVNYTASIIDFYSKQLGLVKDETLITLLTRTKEALEATLELSIPLYKEYSI